MAHWHARDDFIHFSLLIICQETVLVDKEVRQVFVSCVKELSENADSRNIVAFISDTNFIVYNVVLVAELKGLRFNP